MLKNLYLFVGPSGSGKTTTVERLEAKHGWKPVASYTTRPPRYEGEKGHTFVSAEEFSKFKCVAYTLFNGHEYGVTRELLNDSELYVLDIPGVKTLRQHYSDRKFYSIYLDISPEEQAKRMAARGDTDEMIRSRLANDAVMFAEAKDFDFDHRIDASGTIDEVVAEIEAYINAKEAE